MSNDNMKNEAIRRLKVLDLHENVLKDFKDGKLNYSERVKLCPESPVFGCLYWVDNNPEWAEIVKKIEEDHNILVYSLIHDYTEFGEMLTMLYVSSYEEEWQQDYDELCDNSEGSRYVYGYVYNLNCPEFSEFGLIGFKEAGGEERSVAVLNLQKEIPIMYIRTQNKRKLINMDVIASVGIEERAGKVLLVANGPDSTPYELGKYSSSAAASAAMQELLVALNDDSIDPYTMN